MNGAERFTRLSIVLLAFLLPGFARGQYVGVPGPGPVGASQQISLSGWFHVIWEDPLSDSNAEPTIKYILIDDQGQWTEMRLDEKLVRPFGGPLAFNRKRVKVEGAMPNVLAHGIQAQSQGSQLIQVESIEFERPEDAQAATFEVASQAVMGSQALGDYPVPLCGFYLRDATSKELV